MPLPPGGTALATHRMPIRLGKRALLLIRGQCLGLCWEWLPLQSHVM
jgi:hypothetical protein